MKQHQAFYKNFVILHLRVVGRCPSAFFAEEESEVFMRPSQPMCTGRSLCGGLCACSCILCPEVMDCFYPYPVGRSGHLALTHYREAEKYSVVCAERGRKPRTG